MVIVVCLFLKLYQLPVFRLRTVKWKNQISKIFMQKYGILINQSIISELGMS